MTEDAHAPTPCPVCHRADGSHKLDCRPQNRRDAAHAPTDDEREALGDCSCKCGHLYHSECYPRTAEWGGCFDPEPTGDERKWLDSFRRWTLEDVQNSPRTALGAIQRLVAHIDCRCTVQGEPSDDEEADLPNGHAPVESLSPFLARRIVEPQGESTDVVVAAALSALMPEVDWSAKAMLDANPTWVANMRAALRAAAEAEGGNHGTR